MNLKISLGTTYLMLLFYIAPFIDSLSGALVLNGIIPEGGAGSPSQLFRLFLILISIIIIKKSRKIFFAMLLVIFYIILVEYYFFMVHGSIFGYIIGIVYASKLVYLILIFTSLYILSKFGTLTYMSLLKYFRNSIFITSMLLVIPFFLGIGFNTYAEETFGVKGFFAAGNGLGIYMGIGLLLSIYYWKITREKYSLIISLVILFSTIIIGSKTAFVLSIIGLISLIIMLKNKYVSFFSALIVLFSFYMLYEQITETINMVFDVIVLRFNNSESLLSFIFSNRDVYFMDALSTINFDGFLLLRVLIGFGIYISFRNPFTQHNGMDTLESDFADILFMYGIVFLCLYLYFIFYILYKSIMTKQFFLGIIFFLLMIHSIMAGHILFNGMSGILVPILSFTILMKTKRFIS